MEGTKTNRLQLCEFSLLWQISVIAITHTRPGEIDLKHQCGDYRSQFLDRLQKKINPRFLQDRPPHLHQQLTRHVALHVVAVHIGGELLG